MLEVIPGHYYRHYKGNLYRVSCLATDTETGELMVVYQDTNAESHIWVRSYKMFTEKVIYNKTIVSRFKEVVIKNEGGVR